ncbi:hypothetical protein, partial [Leyella stercorea]|uniref:hypothetical protein n=1 Tax=Leyella stercorea TaxID=363265 RepID=UPI003AF0EA91
ARVRPKKRFLPPKSASRNSGSSVTIPLLNTILAASSASSLAYLLLMTLAHFLAIASISSSFLLRHKEERLVSLPIISA